MASDLVSIVVPVYNVEKYLDGCISSIVRQSYKNLEIILVDDGSSDHSPSICDAWARRDRRIRAIHKKNAGAGMARNTGLEHVTGEWVFFFDSDDYVLPETVEKSLNTAKKFNAQIVVFGMQNIGKDGQVIKVSIPESDVCCFKGEEVQRSFLPALIDGRYQEAAVRNLYLSLCSGMFSTDLIRNAGWRFVSERDYFSEDSYSLIWLYQHVTAVAVLPEAYYCYCKHEASLSHRLIRDSYQKICRFYEDCTALVESIGYPGEVKKSVSGLFVSFVIAAMKQIAAADICFSKKKKMLTDIINDETMQHCLQDISGRTYGGARQILFWAIRRRSDRLCYLLLVLQNRIRK